jgi:hypothetical protein
MVVGLGARSGLRRRRSLHDVQCVPRPRSFAFAPARTRIVRPLLFHPTPTNQPTNAERIDSTTRYASVILPTLASQRRDGIVLLCLSHLHCLSFLAPLMRAVLLLNWEK